MVDKQKIENNISLRQYTSMYVGGASEYFYTLKNPNELPGLINFSREKSLPVFVLGGGSNVIVSDSGFNGLTIKNEILGIEKISEDDVSVTYKVGAGENWDKFVEYCVNNNLFGLENLSHIPGTVGASVVQNIGAYGAEVSNSVLSIDVFDTKDLKFENLKKDELYFSYRRSRLNDLNQDKGVYVVTRVYFKLNKSGELNTKYDDLKRYFSDRANSEVNLKNLRQAIISVRDKKFPYPDSPENGTVGSFWNAEVINEATYEKIISKLDNMGFSGKADEMRNKRSVFKVEQGYKIPYGVLIEVLGFKGKKNKTVGILESHAGVINNFSGVTTSKEVMELSQEIIDKVYQEFGVKLRVEPELIGDFT
jgi:UDP-N-acetylmuramate dehydrogenase